MNLFELFDKEVVFHKRIYGKNYTADFSIDDEDYVFTALGDNDGKYIVEFSNQSVKGAGKFDITGTGNSFSVMSAIIRIIKDLVKTMDPLFIIFTAKEDSRKSLYRAVLKRLGMSFKEEMKDGNSIFKVRVREL